MPFWSVRLWSVAWAKKGSYEAVIEASLIKGRKKKEKEVLLEAGLEEEELFAIFMEVSVLILSFSIEILSIYNTPSKRGE